MANIALRSPQFKSIAVSTGALSVVCTVTIGGILRYTLIKNVQQSTTVNFDIAELARDYIEITYQSDYEPQTVSIVTVLTNYDGLNGTGSVVDLPTTITDRGFEAYGTFEEGVNPTIPFRTAPTYLIPTTDTNTFTIFAPNNTAGIIPNITTLNGLSVTPYTVSDTSVTTVDSVVCNIKRIDCTKYGIGNKITYINKYGVQQDLWFFLKEQMRVTNQTQ